MLLDREFAWRHNTSEAWTIDQEGKWSLTRVYSSQRVTTKVVRVEFSDSSVMVLPAEGTKLLDYQGELVSPRVGLWTAVVFPPVDIQDSWSAGYVSSLFDRFGWIKVGPLVQVGLNPNDRYDDALAWLFENGFDYISVGYQALQLLMLLRPLKLIEQLSSELPGQPLYTYAVKQITDICEEVGHVVKYDPTRLIRKGILVECL